MEFENPACVKEMTNMRYGAIIASEKLLHNALKEGALCQKHFRFNLESPVEHPSFIEN